MENGSPFRKGGRIIAAQGGQETLKNLNCNWRGLQP